MEFTKVTVEWSPKTFMFYLMVILGCYIIPILLNKKNIRWKNGKSGKYPLGIAIVSLLLVVVKCFNTTGRDLRSGYIHNFESATSMADYYDKTVEPGFRLLMVLVNKATGSYAVFLFVVGLLTVLPVIHFIHKYEEKIDVPTAFLLYSSIYFINGFSAYRQYMAVSLSLFVLDAILEERQYKALVWIAVSGMIHVSCLVLIIPYLLSFAKVLSKKMIAISALVFFVIFFIGRGSVASMLGGYERYSIYLVSQEIDFGLEQIIYYAPIFLLLYLSRKKIADEGISRVAYIYIITGFMFGMISYILPIFGRMQSVFMPIIILVPYYIRRYKEKCKINKRIVTNIIVFCYSVARFVVWIVQYYNLEDVMPYTNLFGIVI